MEIQEAYKVMQEASGIKAGDEVKILRHPNRHEMGNCISDNEAIRPKIGGTYIVDRIDADGDIRLKKGSNDPILVTSFFCLELVGKVTPPLFFAGKDAVIKDGKVTVGCSTGTYEEVEAIYNAMKGSK